MQRQKFICLNSRGQSCYEFYLFDFFMWILFENLFEFWGGGGGGGSLKFENSLCNNKFFRCIFRSKMIVNAAEKDQIKYFVQN